VTTPQLVVAVSGAGVFAVWSLQWLQARRGRSDAGRIVNPAFRTGALLEAAGFAALTASPVHPLPAWLHAVGAAAAVASAAFGIAAGQHLGRQFRVQAVVTDDHELITGGPYSIVRHPIYASLLVLLIACALVADRALGLVAALPLYIAGTEIRVRAEDKILRARFGERFEQFQARVAAYIPRIR
jgi:protein-S-isoprenylcysteine O-methyltransferase Ste14